MVVVVFNWGKHSGMLFNLQKNMPEVTYEKKEEDNKKPNNVKKSSLGGPGGTPGRHYPAGKTVLPALLK